MKTKLIVTEFVLLACASAFAHSWKAGEGDREALRAHIAEEFVARTSHFSGDTRGEETQQNGDARSIGVTRIASGAFSLQLAAATAANAADAPQTAKAFLPFIRLDLRADGNFLYVGSNGLPDHKMMIGITNWQQQVPLPQDYFGENAWRIPLHPVVAKTPQVVENHFLRGAIALAVNGIPIFNPQNNRGEVSYEIGELDQWGGHCGRADDYHYHIAPLHLESVVGKGMPVAYALDGYPIYGLTEPDGSPVGKLDECHGHEDAKHGYHYHASKQRPYLQSAFHGEVIEREQQVDPQPRAQPVRPALPPVRGAKIDGFESTGTNSYKLSYDLNGDKRSVSYSINADGTYPFVFDNGRDGTAKETYTARGQGGREGGPPRGPEGRGQRNGNGGPRGPGRAGDNPPPGETRPREGPGGEGGRDSRRAEAFVELPDQPRSSDGKFILVSPVAGDLKEMPVEYTGDGEGATLPLDWKGAPSGTQGYALIMDHVAPGGDRKWYWTMWDIPATVSSFPKNVKGIGKIGTGFKGQVGYEPPHSKGPGAKTYVITMYALSASLTITQSPREVSRDVLLAAMKGKVLASSSLRVVHTSGGASEAGRGSPLNEAPFK